MSELRPVSWPVFLLGSEIRRVFGELLADEKWPSAAGLRPPCIGVLFTVADQGPISQAAISRKLSLDPSDLVGVLDILEQAGFVERTRDPDDRRRHAVVATAAGKKKAARLAVIRGRCEDQVLAALTPAERRQLSELLAKVTEGLDRVDARAFATTHKRA